MATVLVECSDAQQWQLVTTDFVSPTEVSALYFTYEGKGSIDFSGFTFLTE